MSLDPLGDAARPVVAAERVRRALQAERDVVAVYHDAADERRRPVRGTGGARAGEPERVIFMSGGAFSAEAQAFLAGVPNPRIDKPFDIGELPGAAGSLVVADDDWLVR